MEKEKKVRKASSGQLCFFGGIALCLLSVVLIMNRGIIAQGLSFLFTYLFGTISYLVYFVIFGYGIYLLLKEKVLKIKFSYRFISYVILFISILMIATLITFKDKGAIATANFKNDVFNANFKVQDEADRRVMSYFKNWDKSNIRFPLIGNGSILGGGLIGFTLVSLLSKIAYSFSIAVVVILILVALAIIIVPIILKRTNKNGASFKSKKVKETKIDDPFEEEKQERKPLFARKQPVDNYDVISSANIVTPDQQRSEIIGAPEQISEPTNDSMFSNTGEIYSNVGMFVPSHFYKNGAPRQQAQISAQSNFIEKKEDETISGIEAIIQSNEQQTSMEKQAMLEQNPIPVVDNSLQQPLYQQPQPVPQVVQQNIFSEPIRENPKENYVEVLGSLAPQQPQQQYVQPQVAPAVQPQVKKEPVKWVAPSTELLKVHDATGAIELNSQIAEERCAMINQTFENYGIDAKIVDYTIGPSVTRYNVTYGVRTSSREVGRIVDDIAIRLGGVSARFESIVEGRTTSGIEIPNAKITTVSFKEVFDALPDVKKKPLALAFGKNIEGKVISADLCEFPHALIAGTTGSGKSVFVNSLICSLIMRNSPDALKMVLIDPKKVEFGKYKDMPHLLCKIINDPTEAKNLLLKLVDEMNDRYGLFEASPTGATNIQEYNSDCEVTHAEKLPYIVVVVDEYADLVDNCKDISLPVISLAQKARACGIHILLATQRPSVSVVTGVLKANLPTHVALSCASTVDSQTIIGEGGAEKLMGKGDMLAQSPLISRNGPVRLQSCYIDREEIMHIVGYLKDHYETHYDEKYIDLADKAEEEGAAFVKTPEFKSNGENGEEAKYREIKDWVMSQNYMSMSRIQRECGVGFNRAGRFFIRLQEEGVVGKEVEGNKGCPVLMQDKFGDVDDVPVSSVDSTDFNSEH